MKHYMRVAIQELEALGFTQRPDPFGRAGKRVFVHPYEPDTELRLWDGSSEAACAAIRRKANEIARLGSAGPAMPKSIGQRVQTRRRKQQEDRNRQDAARTERAENAEREHQKREALVAADNHRREIERLMGARK